MMLGIASLQQISYFVEYLSSIISQLNNISTISINRTQPLSASTNSDYPHDPVEYLDHLDD
jgi:hypothetical protein